MPSGSARATLRSIVGKPCSSAKVFSQDEEAVPQLRQQSRSTSPRISTSVALARLGRLDEARIPAKEALAIDPTFTIPLSRGRASDNPVSRWPTAHLQ
jgi:hypothetical protein